MQATTIRPTNNATDAAAPGSKLTDPNGAPDTSTPSIITGERWWLQLFPGPAQAATKPARVTDPTTMEPATNSCNLVSATTPAATNTGASTST